MNESGSAAKRSHPPPSDDHVGASSMSKISEPTAPAFPPPVAQRTSREPSQRQSDINPQAKAVADRARHDSKDVAYKSESLSSAGGSLITTPISSVDLEKRGLAKEPRRPRHNKPTRDLEKAAPHHRRGSREHHQHAYPAPLPYSEDDTMDEARHVQEEKAVNILLYLSFPCMILSALNAAWTILSLIITALTQPVRLCARRPTFGQQLGGLLGPALNLQLKCIHTPLPPHANEDTSYRPFMLVAVQLLSPFLSLGITLAAWVVAAYWISSAIVGDPAGLDKRDDGRETALALRDWWEKWLTRSTKEF